MGKVTLCSVGDLMICDSPLYASVGVGSRYQKLHGKLFQGCKEVFDSAEIVIGNFETVVHEPANRSLAETQMCCSEEVVRELRDAGFSILNLANNHCMQHGTAGFENTKNVCRKYGIQPIGIRDEEPYLMEVNGVSFAFLSLCIHLEWYEPKHILYENRIDKVLKNVQQLRKQNDDLVIVVTAHWGDEFASYPSNAQIALAHRFVDCGADVILGHHSHVVQGIEEYNGSVIVYGQGNFISDMVPQMCRQTGIVRIEIESNAEKRVGFEFLPYEIMTDQIPAPVEGDWFSDRQERLKEALEGAYSDEDYWKNISRNHGKAHGDFKTFFAKNIGRYNLKISSRMLWEFAGRKMKRILGTTTDGKVSSMDPEIYRVLQGTSCGELIHE